MKNALRSAVEKATANSSRPEPGEAIQATPEAQ
jgi:hypothetical protein